MVLSSFAKVLFCRRGPAHLKCPGSHEAEIDFDSRRRRKVPRGFKDNTN